MITTDLSKKIESKKLRLIKGSSISQKKKLENCFKKFSKKTLAIDLSGKEITYEVFFKNSLKLISYFKKKGLKKNSNILVSSDNCLNYLIVLTACLFGGYVVCPIDPSLKSERLNELKSILKFDYTISDPNKLVFNNDIEASNLISYENDDFLMIYTSGTTGEPKGILFSSNSFLKSSYSFSKLADYTEETRILHCLPMFYMAGILNTFFSCLFSGSTVVVGEEISASNILNFWEFAKKHQTNSLHLTPSIVGLLCKMHRQNFEVTEHIKKYKSIITTGSYLYPEIQEKFYKLFNKRVLSCYGVTELGGPLTIQSWEDTFVERCVGSHSNEVKIKIEKGKDKINTVMINSPFIMKGYLSAKGLEKPVLNDGFYNTEDVGDYKDGLLFIEGRTRDIIKKGGELISLPLIESILLQHKSILEVAAVGKENLLVGEDLYLFVMIEGQYNLEEKILEIREFLKKKLRPVELPKKIIIVPQIPKNRNGKIKKKDLINLYTI